MSPTDKPKQWYPKYPGGHRSKKDHEIQDTGSPAKGMSGLAEVKTSGSIYIQMPNVIKAITISDDNESNEEMEKQSKLLPNGKLLLVEIDEDKDDKNKDDMNKNDMDKDDKDPENDYVPYLSWMTVDDYLESIFGIQTIIPDCCIRTSVYRKM